MRRLAATLILCITLATAAACSQRLPPPDHDSGTDEDASQAE